MYTQTEKVNIEPKSYLPVFRISQNDVGRTLKAHLVSDEGTITIPASATVTMAGIKPSGLGYTVTGTINGSDVTFETNATMTDEAGQIESEIRIVDGETLIGTTNVVLNIEPNPHPDDTTDGQCEPLVNEITALLNQITAQADRTEEYSSKVLNMTVSAHESEAPTVTKTEGEVVNLDFGLPRGEKGERGERGEQGEAGKDGKDGIDGKDGKDGKDGINGVTPDFSIGTVTTLEPNESASVTLTGTEEEPVLNFGIPRGVKGEQGEVSLNDLKKIMVTDTASGAIASFPDGSDLLPALSLVANIVPKQSGTGTPSPDNIRPISGWESVVISQSPYEQTEKHTITGKNLFNAPNNDAGELVACHIDANQSFVASANISCGIRYYDANKTQIDWWSTLPNTYGDRKYRALSANQAIEYVEFYGSGNPTDLMIELGNEPSDYEPYGTSHTTSLGRTVYGGTLDVVSGELVVDRAMVDLGDVTWNYNSTYSCWMTSAIANVVKKYPTQAEMITAITEKYVVDPAGILNGANFTAGKFILGTSGNLFVKTGSNSETPTGAFVYELATPQTYTLTPQTINTLLGCNNVWADSGDCSIVYYADTKLYIDKKLGGN